MVNRVCLNCKYAVWECGLYCTVNFDRADMNSKPEKVKTDDTCDKFERYAGADYDHSESEGALT